MFCFFAVAEGECAGTAWSAGSNKVHLKAGGVILLFLFRSSQKLAVLFVLLL